MKGHEYDTLTSWKNVVASADRPGVRKYDKRQYNKRVRIYHKKEIMDSLDS